MASLKPREFHFEAQETFEMNCPFETETISFLKRIKSGIYVQILGRLHFGQVRIWASHILDRLHFGQVRIWASQILDRSDFGQIFKKTFGGFQYVKTVTLETGG